MNALNPIFDAYTGGWPALLVTGRPLSDLDLDDAARMRTLFSALSRRAFAQHGMVVLSYTLATGLEFGLEALDSRADRDAAERVLRAHGLKEREQDRPGLHGPAADSDAVDVIRGLIRLFESADVSARTSDGREMRFGCFFGFPEHLAPAGQNSTLEQMLTVELAVLASENFMIRRNRHLIAFHGREGVIDDRLAGLLHHVRLPMPDVTAKSAFVEAALTANPGARFADGLSVEQVANLTSSTPNRGLEATIRSSDHLGRPIGAVELVSTKERDVVHMSEGTLSLLRTDVDNGDELRGRNVAAVVRVLQDYADRLATGDRRLPLAMLLAGPPGNGKSIMAQQLARRSGVPAYRMLNPKAGIVGETERRARLQHVALHALAPSVAFLDELTDTYPLRRSSFDGDSGASKAVLGELLQALADESRQGRTLLIAATNRPWELDAPFQDRFEFLPVLYPLREDMPEVVASIANRIAGTATVAADDTAVSRAAELYFRKGASPRRVVATINRAFLATDRIDGSVLMQAAEDFCGASDFQAIVHADLSAIYFATYRPYLPWAEAPSDYPFPDHIAPFVDARTGEIDKEQLAHHLSSLEAGSD